jgi:hypothetical protein
LLDEGIYCFIRIFRPDREGQRENEKRRREGRRFLSEGSLDRWIVGSLEATAPCQPEACKSKAEDSENAGLCNLSRGAEEVEMQIGYRGRSA